MGLQTRSHWFRVESFWLRGCLEGFVGFTGFLEGVRVLKGFIGWIQVMRFGGFRGFGGFIVFIGFMGFIRACRKRSGLGVGVRLFVLQCLRTNP